jgi:hypothetical protein
VLIEVHHAAINERQLGAAHGGDDLIAGDEDHANAGDGRYKPMQSRDRAFNLRKMCDCRLGRKRGSDTHTESDD